MELIGLFAAALAAGAINALAGGGSFITLPALLFYLAAYTVTNTAAFAVSTALPECRDLGDYRGLAQARPWLSAALVVSLLGLLGTPPTAVFVGKLTTAASAWDGGVAWLAVTVFVNTLLSLFYYLRWIVPCYQRVDFGPDFPAQRWSAGIAVVSAALSVVLGVGAGVVWSVLAG